MLEALSMYSDELMELLLGEEEVPEQLIHEIIRDAVLAARVHPRVHGHAPTRTRACSRCWTR